MQHIVVIGKQVFLSKFPKLYFIFSKHLTLEAVFGQMFVNLPTLFFKKESFNKKTAISQCDQIGGVKTIKDIYTNSVKYSVSIHSKQYFDHAGFTKRKMYGPFGSSEDMRKQIPSQAEISPI